MKRLIIYISVFTLFFFLSDDLEAQCAMCKATAESASDNVSASIGKGLNRGIIYLMIAPYLLLTIIGYVFFRKKIKTFFKELAHHS